MYVGDDINAKQDKFNTMIEDLLCPEITIHKTTTDAYTPTHRFLLELVGIAVCPVVASFFLEQFFKFIDGLFLLH